MPHKRRRVLRVLLHPLIVISIVVVLITTGWLLYTGGTSGIAHARPGANLLPALDSTAAASAAGAPAASSQSAPAGSVGGWNVSHSGDAQTSLELADGKLVERGLKLDITQYASGDVTLTSPRVDVEPGKTHLFKAFTTTNTPFALLARQHHADGSTTLKQLPNPLERPGDAPFTVSDAFDSGDTTTAVEYVFRLASKGTIRVEGAYLEAADDVRLPSAAATAPTSIPNPELAGSQPGAPGSWSPFASGALTAESGRAEDEDGSFFWTRIANYQNGEAKWQYQPVPVTTDRLFQFGATYPVRARGGRGGGVRARGRWARVPQSGDGAAAGGRVDDDRKGVPGP